MNKEKIKNIVIIVLGTLLFFSTCNGCSKKQESAFLQVKIEEQDSIIKKQESELYSWSIKDSLWAIQDSINKTAYKNQVKATEMANNRKVNVIIKNNNDE